MELLQDPAVWLSFATLVTLEIVLGVDNLVFIAILSGRLPIEQQPKARKVGLALALISRLLLLSGLAFIVKLTQPVFELFGHAVSWRDLVLIAGGLFLLVKATHEIHNSLEGEGDGTAHGQAGAKAAFGLVVTQIAILDIIFSLDSVITAVGMVQDIEVMVAAVIVAVLVMLVASDPLSAFVSRHPTVKMLALSFLFLVGMSLVAEGFQFHIPKGYIYFSMGFSILVELLNQLARRRKARKPVQLRKSI
jgi:predicted tellurium resistance membrane protein TerC